jgi:hypothetical protein
MLNMDTLYMDTTPTQLNSLFQPKKLNPKHLSGGIALEIKVAHTYIDSLCIFKR